MLNSEQKKAVNHIDGPMMVLAGAGSGKTRVLTSRISNLIENGVSPYSILAVTFTNKASREMKERLSNILKDYSVDVSTLWVSTFHSICVRVLRSNILKLDGYNKNFTIIDQNDSKIIIKKMLKDEMGLDTKEHNPKLYMNLIGKFYNQINKQLFFAELSGNISIVLEQLIEKYVNYKKNNNLIDFQDLIVKTIELFKSDKETLEYYQDKFKYVLVDEFQDTNNLQFQLINMLCAKDNNIFVVGDMDQSIYSFRGANYENITKFKKKYSPKVIKLEENYRSTKNILGAANSVIVNNKNRIDKLLKTNNELGNEVIYYRAPTSRDEVSFIKSQIELFVRNGIKYDEFAVIYRTNAMSREVEQEFMRYNIPYKVHGGMSFFDKMEVKDLVAYLNLIIIPEDNWSFQRVVNKPKRGIGPTTVNKLYDFAMSKNISMFEAVDKSEEILSKSTATKLKTFKNTIIKLREQVNIINLKDLIEEISKETGYYAYLDGLGEEGQIRKEYINEMKSLVATAQKDNGDRFQSNFEILNDVLTNIALKNPMEEKTKVEKEVTLMSIHAAKGLEFKFVFIIGLENGIFPGYQNLDDIISLEEERRLCYVAMTRAEKGLFLTNAISRMQYGEMKNNPPSIFIGEVDTKYIGKYGVVNQPKQTMSVSKEKFNKSDYIEEVEEINLNTGDKIKHKVFGKGVIVSCDGDFINVAFSVPHGIKKLMKNHKAIKKI